MEKLLDKILLNKEKVFNKFGDNVNIDSIIVFDNNEVQEYFFKNEDIQGLRNFEDIDRLHELRSISKVLIALAYGIVFEKTNLTPDTFVYPIIKNLVNIENDNNFEKIKKWQIKHLLTYSCGYDKMMFSQSLIKNIKNQKYLDYLVNYPLVYEPGEKSVYNNAEIYLLSVCFQEVFGENISKFIEREIFKPLGIKEYVWYDLGGYCQGGTGLYLKHRDLFKIAELILNYGRFENKQIISKYYIKEMCSEQMETPNAYKPERVLPKIGVGFIMHISRDGYVYKDGTNGQYMIINFDKKQIITIFSSEEDMSCVTEVLRGLI